MIAYLADFSFSMRANCCFSSFSIVKDSALRFSGLFSVRVQMNPSGEWFSSVSGPGVTFAFEDAEKRL